MTTVDCATQVLPSRLAVLHAAAIQTSHVDNQAAGHFYELWTRGNVRTKLTIEFLRTAGTVVLRLAGQLDETTTSQLERECAYWLNRGEKTLVLDFESVQVVRSEGVRSVLIAGKQLAQVGGSLVLCGLYSSVGRIFRLHGVDAFFQTFDTLEEFEGSTHEQVIQ